MNRGLLFASQLLRPTLRRSVHKGAECTPPLRFTSVSEQLVLFGAIAVAFLSYPTYVLLNLDNIRPRADNALNPEAQAKLDEARAARATRRK